MIQASVAVYPLHQETNAAVDRAIQALREAGVAFQVRSMNTEILGSTEQVFAALQRAFEAAASAGATVMTITLSNACPLPPQHREADA